MSPIRLTGLAANIAAFVGAALLMNGLIFALGWGGDEARIEPVFAPPGWVIGIVWTGLFAGMGAARAQLLAKSNPKAREEGRIVVYLAVFCAAYPAYTVGLSNLAVGLAGNVLTMIAAGLTTIRLWPHSRCAAMLVFAIVPWVVFATALVVRVLQLNR